MSIPQVEARQGLQPPDVVAATLTPLATRAQDIHHLELDRLVAEGERGHTFFAVEEPEAHLHPHVQRLVHRYFLEGGAAATNRTTILTTHSPIERIGKGRFAQTLAAHVTHEVYPEYIRSALEHIRDAVS